jgi:hypothetical protein
MPSCPKTSSVIPCRSFIGSVGSASTCTSEWLCVSMKPGHTTWPVQSIVSRPTRPGPTAAMRPSAIATSATKRARPCRPRRFRP